MLPFASSATAPLLPNSSPTQLSAEAELVNSQKCFLNDFCERNSAKSVQSLTVISGLLSLLCEALRVLLFSAEKIRAFLCRKISGSDFFFFL